MVDGSIKGTVTINDIEYSHQDIQKITKPFIPNNILKQHVDNLKRIADLVVLVVLNLQQI